MPETSCAQAGDALAALRERGIARRDPVRFRLAEALARRAAAHSGAARRCIDDRLAALLARLGADDGPAPRARSAATARGPLGELVAQLAARRPQTVAGLAGGTLQQAARGPAADPATLQFFKRTWSRLSADQRLAQSRACLPDNAGPLNSQHLVHRSLTLMHALSPEYLEHFVGYVDALLWLEQANEAAPPGGPGKNMAARR
jgi:hypothetical protein